jgi:hypothetical protein
MLCWNKDKFITLHMGRTSINENYLRPRTNFFIPLGIFVAVLVAVGLLYAFFNNPGNNVNNTAINPSPAVTQVLGEGTETSPTIEETRERYVNNNGYSLLLPDGYKIEDNARIAAGPGNIAEVNSLTILQNDDNFQETASSINLKIEALQSNSYVSSSGTVQIADLAHLARLSQQDNTTIPGVAGTVIRSTTETTFAGERAFTFAVRGTSVDLGGYSSTLVVPPGQPTPAPRDIVFIITQNEGKYYIIAYEEVEPFITIASSFRFE